jgi:hypothetical protein
MTTLETRTVGLIEYSERRMKTLKNNYDLSTCVRGALPKFPHCAPLRRACYGGESHRVAHALR